MFMESPYYEDRLVLLFKN